MGDDQTKKPLRFKLKKETIEELGSEELSIVSGGTTFSCCAGCATAGATDCRCGPQPK